MDVRGIKLMTGEELIAKVLRTTDNGTLVVEDPLVVHMGLSEKGGLMCQFAPWTIITEGEIAIMHHSVIATYTVDSNVEKTYLKRVSSIEVVSDPATASVILHG